LDRDGTIIEDRGYLASPDDVALLPGAAEGLGLLKSRGFLLVVVSNQSGVARGVMSRDAMQAVHDRMAQELARQGCALDAAYYCPHGPGEGCECRKPAPGLLLRAAREQCIDLGASVTIGDQERDIRAGQAAGCRFLVRLAKGGVDSPARDGSLPLRGDGRPVWADGWPALTKLLQGGCP
jgi:histidinol-phosphate phosphatase family protein